MKNEYGCGKESQDSKCTSLAEIPCLCGICQKKLIYVFEATQQSVPLTAFGDDWRVRLCKYLIRCGFRVAQSAAGKANR